MHIMEKHMRVAIYIRVSTKLQEDRYSLKAQQTELTRYAEAQGWTIVDTYKDVESGAKINKEGLEALLDAVEDGLVDVVLVIEQDRLSRLDVADWQYLKDVLRENKVKIAEPGNIIDLTNENDEFFSDLKNLLASHRRRNIKRTMGRGLRQYTREGRVMGRIPDEYIYDKNTQTPIVNEDRAWIIPFIDRLYLEEAMGTHRIAKELNKRCKTAQGAKWTDVQVRKRLMNKNYHGVLTRNYSTESMEVEDVFPKLRTKETYDRIQSRMNTLKKELPPTNFRHGLRQLKLTCAHCGKALRLNKLERPEYGDNGKTYAYILHVHETSPPCPVMPTYSANQVLRPLLVLVKDLLLDNREQLISKHMQSSETAASEIDDLEKDIKRLRLDIKDKQDMLDRLLNLYLTGTWTMDKLDANKKTIEADVAVLTEELKAVEQKLSLIKQDKYNIEAVLNLAGEYADDFLSLFMRSEYTMPEFMSVALPSEIDDDELEKIIATLFERITLDSETMKAEVLARTTEGFSMPLYFEIDPVDLIADAEARMKRYRRYRNTVAILKSQSEPIEFMELSRLTGHKAETLNRDAEEFGAYKGLKLKKGSPEKRAFIIQTVKDCLARDINMRTKDIAKLAYCSNVTVQKIIRELELRPTRK